MRPFVSHTAAVRALLPLSAAVFASGGEDGCIRCFDARERDDGAEGSAASQSGRRSLLVDQRLEQPARMLHAGVLSLAQDPLRPHFIAAGGNDALGARACLLACLQCCGHSLGHMQPLASRIYHISHLHDVPQLADYTCSSLHMCAAACASHGTCCLLLHNTLCTPFPHPIRTVDPQHHGRSARCVQCVSTTCACCAAPLARDGQILAPPLLRPGVACWRRGRTVVSATAAASVVHSPARSLCAASSTH